MIRKSYTSLTSCMFAWQGSTCGYFVSEKVLWLMTQQRCLGQTHVGTKSNIVKIPCISRLRRKSSAVEDTDFCLILIFIKKPRNQDVWRRRCRSCRRQWLWYVQSWLCWWWRPKSCLPIHRWTPTSPGNLCFCRVISETFQWFFIWHYYWGNIWWFSF